MAIPLWLEIANSKLGLKEIKGKKHNPLIVAMWKLIKRGGIKDDETPWCAAFVGACLEEAGIVSSRFESAKSYLAWGIPLADPIVGAIAVKNRPGGQHVFFVTGKTKDGRITGIGGNQSDAVTETTFARDEITALRWPSAVPITDRFLPVRAINTKAGKES